MSKGSRPLKRLQSKASSCETSDKNDLSAPSPTPGRLTESLPKAPDPKKAMTMEVLWAQCTYELRIPLDSVAPSWLNRRGAPLSARHCHDLAERFDTVSPFEVRRYFPAICHEADPNQPLRVAQHYNKMAQASPLLAPIEERQLYGSLAKSHLWAALFAMSRGTVFWFGDPQKGRMKPNQDQTQLMEHIRSGLHYRVIRWSAVVEFPDIVLQIMDTDNESSSHDLPEDELGLARRVIALKGTEAKPGKMVSEAIGEEILKTPGGKWTQCDVTSMYKCVRYIQDMHFDFLTQFHSLLGDVEIVVPTRFYSEVARLNEPWAMIAVLADQIMTPKKVAIKYRGSWQACNWRTRDVTALKAMFASDEMRKLGQMIGDIYTTYTDFCKRAAEAGIPKPGFFNAICKFMWKTGNHVARVC